MHEGRLQRWMRTQAGPSTSADAFVAPSRARVPNQYMMQAWDHGLKGGCGISLARFMPDRRISALSKDQVRFFVSADGCPNPAPFAPDEPVVRRSCVLDKSTSDSWLELPRVVVAGAEGIHRPSVHVCIDQGSIGWPGWVYCFCELGVRGTLWMDPWHRIANNLDLAVKNSSLFLIQLETSILFNVGSGPWDRAAFHGAIVGAAAQYLKVATPSDDLLNMFFYGLCADELDFPSDMGRSAHQERVHARLQENFVFKGKGDKVKLGRWFAWWDAADGKLESWHQLLLFMTYYGVLYQY